MDSAGQNTALQGISPQIVSLALQNGIICSSAVSTIPATLNVAYSNQGPSTSYSTIGTTQPLSVPHFEAETFKNVNLTAAPSSLITGLDLPTDDVPTLRFFYNLGVQTLRSYQDLANLVALPQVAQCITSSPNQLSLSALQNEQQAQMLRQYREGQQLASQQAIRDLQTQLYKNQEIVNSQTASQQLSVLYPPSIQQAARSQLHNLLLQNSLLNSNVDWRAFDELFLRARLFTAALDMVPRTQNDAFRQQTVSTEASVQNVSNETVFGVQDEPPSPSRNDNIASSATFDTPSKTVPVCKEKTSEKSSKKSEDSDEKKDSQEVSSSIAQPLPIRPTPNKQVAIYDMQVSHALLAASEMHYNETFRNSELALQNNSETENQTEKQLGSDDGSGAEQESQVSPQVLINMINTYLSKVKRQLYEKGVGVLLDSQGLPRFINEFLIDFSARPVDPIFRNAREQLEIIREYGDAVKPVTNHVPVDGNRRTSPSVKEVENHYKPPSKDHKERETNRSPQPKTAKHCSGDGIKQCSSQECNVSVPAEKRRRVSCFDNQ